jgi:hypothetical protein
MGNAMSFNAYLAELRKNLAKGDATELTHRRAQLEHDIRYTDAAID